MKTKWIDQKMNYDGSQLKSLYAYLNYETPGDSVVAWRGPCNISFDKMVDGEDLLQKAQICGSDMLHFIVELFDVNLNGAISFQRLTASMAKDLINAHLNENKVVREGDDLYWNDGKLSISIASVSPVSCMIHFAVNVDNAGTPVKTAALNDFQMEPVKFAKDLMQKMQSEWESIRFAGVKVRALN